MDKKQPDLEVLVEKLRKNRMKLGITILKTKYAKKYKELCSQITELAVDRFLDIAAALPDWFDDFTLSADDEKEIKRIYDEARMSQNVSKGISDAIFKHYDVSELEEIAQATRNMFWQALRTFTIGRAAIWVENENLDADNPKKPKAYHPFMRKFWDEESQDWRDPLPGELEKPHVLILINKKEKKRKEKSNDDGIRTGLDGGFSETD